MFVVPFCDSLGVGVSTAMCVPCYMFVVPFCEGQPWCGCVHCLVCVCHATCLLCHSVRDSLGVGVSTAMLHVCCAIL